MNTVVRRYGDQHYCTMFNADTGCFARVEDQGYAEPFWSWHGPELLDIAITNWCDRRCSICYRGSDGSGRHMPISDYEMLMSQAREMSVLQVALGGGNPNQHPDFPDIIKLTRTEYDIVPNYTTNGRGLTEDVLEASRDYCGAVAVSAYAPYKELDRAVSALVQHAVRTHIHFVLTASSLDTAINWLSCPPEFLRKVDAIIFLNYKPVGRSSEKHLLLNRSARLEEFFRLVDSQDLSLRIGFDACSASGIASFTSVPGTAYDGCDAGRFSMFISENLMAYPCSFMCASYEGHRVDDSNLLHIWQHGGLFRGIRQRLAVVPVCGACPHLATCRGGCPCFPLINLCHGQGH